MWKFPTCTCMVFVRYVRNIFVLNPDAFILLNFLCHSKSEHKQGTERKEKVTFVENGTRIPSLRIEWNAGKLESPRSWLTWSWFRRQKVFRNMNSVIKYIYNMYILCRLGLYNDCPLVYLIQYSYKKHNFHHVPLSWRKVIFNSDLGRNKMCGN